MQVEEPYVFWKCLVQAAGFLKQVPALLPAPKTVTVCGLHLTSLIRELLPSILTQEITHCQIHLEQGRVFFKNTHIRCFLLFVLNHANAPSPPAFPNFTISTCFPCVRTIFLQWFTLFPSVFPSLFDNGLLKQSWC